MLYQIKKTVFLNSHSVSVRRFHKWLPVTSCFFFISWSLIFPRSKFRKYKFGANRYKHLPLQNSEAERCSSMKWNTYYNFTETPRELGRMEMKHRECNKIIRDKRTRRLRCVKNHTEIPSTYVPLSANGVRINICLGSCSFSRTPIVAVRN